MHEAGFTSHCNFRSSFHSACSVPVCTQRTQGARGCCLLQWLWPRLQSHSAEKEGRESTCILYISMWDVWLPLLTVLFSVITLIKSEGKAWSSSALQMDICCSVFCDKFPSQLHWLKNVMSTWSYLSLVPSPLDTIAYSGFGWSSSS